jgi:hypothetical protein
MRDAGTLVAASLRSGPYQLVTFGGLGLWSLVAPYVHKHLRKSVPARVLGRVVMLLESTVEGMMSHYGWHDESVAGRVATGVGHRSREHMFCRGGDNRIRSLLEGSVQSQAGSWG